MKQHEKCSHEGESFWDPSSERGKGVEPSAYIVEWKWYVTQHSTGSNHLEPFQKMPSNPIKMLISCAQTNRRRLSILLTGFHQTPNTIHT
jgi:hypothetical protein